VVIGKSRDTPTHGPWLFLDATRRQRDRVHLRHRPAPPAGHL